MQEENVLMAVSAAEIAEKAIELGYDKCGIIPVEMDARV